MDCWPSAHKTAENKRVAHDYLDDDQNEYKSLSGFEDGLKDPKLMDRKREEERRLRAAIDSDPEKKKKYGKIWDQIAAAYGSTPLSSNLTTCWKARPRIHSSSPSPGRQCAMPKRSSKPNDQRLREYQDAGLESLEQRMYSSAPLNNALEELVLADDFRFLQKELGADDPQCRHSGADEARAGCASLCLHHQDSGASTSASAWLTISTRSRIPRTV